MARGASNILYAQGWRNHRVLDEGLPGWHAKRYPVEGKNITATPGH
jgi:3-mercaptopyruvate sulfurtransferase SseA